MNGRAQPGQVVLDQVVARAGVHAADGRLLVDRSGDDDEGNGRGELPHQRQRRHPVEPGDGIVREDHGRLKQLQRADEVFPGLHPPGLTLEARPLELVLDQLGVEWLVIEDQDSHRRPV